MNSFTYCWTDHKTNKLYVGIHKGSLDDGYICSSKLMLKEYKIRPDDFTREILARGMYADMLKFEAAILKAVDAKNNPDFYNAHNGDGKFCNVTPHTQETKEKLKMAWARNPNRMTNQGKKHTQETKEKMRLAKLGKKHSQEHIAKATANRTINKELLSIRSKELWAKRKAGILPTPIMGRGKK